MVLYLTEDLMEEVPALGQVGEKLWVWDKKDERGGCAEAGTMLNRVQCPIIK